MYRPLPTLLSLSRIPCAILVIVFYSETERWRFEAAITVISIALATDFLDGALARKFGLTSKHGYVVDGLGDRAIYIALWLAFMVHQKIGLITTWLLIFREVAIYAARLFSSQWFEANKSVRFLSVLHAWFLRFWMLSVLAEDGIFLYSGIHLSELRGFAQMQSALFIVALLVSYYSLFRHLWAILAATDL